MKIPASRSFQKSTAKLTGATFKKAFISSYNESARTVDVYFANNLQTVIKGIPIADPEIEALQTIINELGSDFLIGKKCRIDIFDEKNPKDMVMAYTWN